MNTTENKMTLREALIEASERGYKVTESGEVIGPAGNQMNPQHRECYKYKQFTLRHRNSRKTTKVMVHRLQAFQKYGEQLFQPGIMVRHLDGNSLNNAADNIAIGTASDNMMDQTKEMRVRKATLAALKYDPVAIRAFYAETKSYRKTQEQFGIKSKGTIHNILNRPVVTRPPSLAALIHT